MQKSVQNNIIFALITFLVLGAFYAIYMYGVNVPHWDDHAVRNYVDSFYVSGMFKFHNEHRLGLTRLVALITNSLSGELDFKWLMYFGQFSLVGLLAAYYYTAKKLVIPKIGLLILAMCIFNFSTFENSLWGMAAVQNHGILFFASATLITLSLTNIANKYIFALAVILSLCCLVTSGNGVLVPPIGFLLLFLRRETKMAWYWLGIHAIVFTCYFIGFSRNGGQMPHIESFFLNSIALSGSLIYPVLGKGVNAIVPSLVGVTNMALSLFVFFRLFFLKDSNQKLLIFLGLQAFFFGTLALIAISRNDYETAVLLSSKYKIYSFLIFGTNAFFGSEFLSNKKVYYLLIGFTILIFFNAQLSYWPAQKALKLERTADLFNLKQDYTQSSSFKLTSQKFEASLKSELAIADEGKVDSIAFINDKLLFFENNLAPRVESYIWLKSDSAQYLEPLNNMSYSLLKASAGRADLDLRNFKSNVYEIYLLEVDKLKSKLYNTNKTVRIEGVEFTEAAKNW
ncbi:MAG: hypothetical protein ACI9K1_000396 [Arcticibacterium sp.]|jgi:hypothetical protein